MARTLEDENKIQDNKLIDHKSVAKGNWNTILDSNLSGFKIINLRYKNRVLDLQKTLWELYMAVIKFAREDYVLKLEGFSKMNNGQVYGMVTASRYLGNPFRNKNFNHLVFRIKGWSTRPRARIYRYYNSLGFIRPRLIQFGRFEMVIDAEIKWFHDELESNLEEKVENKEFSHIKYRRQFYIIDPKTHKVLIRPKQDEELVKRAREFNRGWRDREHEKMVTIQLFCYNPKEDSLVFRRATSRKENPMDRSNPTIDFFKIDLKTKVLQDINLNQYSCS